MVDAFLRLLLTVRVPVTLVSIAFVNCHSLSLCCSLRIRATAWSPVTDFSPCVLSSQATRDVVRNDLREYYAQAVGRVAVLLPEALQVQCFQRRTPTVAHQV